MLTTDELRALIADHESNRVELTTSTKKTDKFGEAVCAFANDFPNHGQPGYPISGDLITVLREVETFVSLPAQSHPVTESALRERTAVDYPPVAIRELLLNAIMHRSYESNAPVRFYWYDARIEIQNPGGLYGMVSPENFRLS